MPRAWRGAGRGSAPASTALADYKASTSPARAALHPNLGVRAVAVCSKGMTARESERRRRAPECESHAKKGGRSDLMPHGALDGLAQVAAALVTGAPTSYSGVGRLGDGGCCAVSRRSKAVGVEEGVPIVVKLSTCLTALEKMFSNELLNKISTCLPRRQKLSQRRARWTARSST